MRRIPPLVGLADEENAQVEGAGFGGGVEGGMGSGAVGP